MARFDPMTLEGAAVDGAPAMAGEALLRLGMSYSTGREGAADLVSAHKWFNLAALKGSREALRYRQEVAQEMSEAEIAAALASAREWLGTH